MADQIRVNSEGQVVRVTEVETPLDVAALEAQHAEQSTAHEAKVEQFNSLKTELENSNQELTDLSDQIATAKSLVPQEVPVHVEGSEPVDESLEASAAEGQTPEAQAEANGGDAPVDTPAY